MSTVPAIVAVAVTIVSLSSSVGESAEWTLGMRGGYAWPLSMTVDQESEGLYLVAVASHPLADEAALFVTLGYLGIPGRRASYVCPFAPDPIGDCPSLIVKTTVLPATVGLRLGGEREDGKLEPWWEVSQAVFYGHWMDDRSASAHWFFLGWQTSIGVPVPLSERWALHAGFSYLNSESVDPPAVGFAGIQGFRELLFFGGLSRRLGRGRS